MFFFLVFLVFIGCLIYDILFKKRLILAGKRANFHASLLIRNIKESLSGFKEIKILGNKYFFLGETKKNSDLYGKYSTKIGFLAIIPRYIIEFAFVFLILSFTLFILFTYDNASSYVSLISIYGFSAIRLIPSINGIISSVSSLRATKDSVSKIHKELFSVHTFPELKNNLNATFSSFQNLKLKNVCFNHESIKNPTLKDVNITINKGDIIGIVGESGSGKSTLLTLFLGFYQNSSGEVLYNDSPLNESLVSWRSQIAYLPQEQFMLDDSIKRNVALGVVDEEIDIAKVHSSLNRAMLAEYIDTLPDGIESQIGDNGVRISGGQKQRIGIARALYHVVIFSF